MATPLTEKSASVLNFVKAATAEGKNITSAEIAAALGMESKRSADGVLTGLQKRKLIERIPAEIELEDGSHKAIKLVKATEAGMAFVPGVTDAQEEDAE